MPMIAMTTSSSTSVKPRCFLFMAWASSMHLFRQLSSAVADNIKLEVVTASGCHFDCLLALGIVFGRDTFGGCRRQSGLAGCTPINNRRRCRIWGADFDAIRSGRQPLLLRNVKLAVPNNGTGREQLLAPR